MAGWIKIPLSTKVGLDPCLLWPNDWMDEDGTWHARGPWLVSWSLASLFSTNMAISETNVGLGRGLIVLDGDPALPSRKGTEAPIFRPYS